MYKRQCPHSPDNVKPVRSLSMTKVDQVCIGSCTNSSYADLMTVAEILTVSYTHLDVYKRQASLRAISAVWRSPMPKETISAPLLSTMLGSTSSSQ